MKPIYHFFDRLEDRVRAKLSHYPIIYSLIAGTSLVIFWRGVWGIADHGFTDTGQGISYVYSLIVSTLVLLVTGLFTSFFVGDTILISGLKREKKLIEKTEEEVSREGGVLKRLQSELSREGSVLQEVRQEVADLKDVVLRLEALHHQELHKEK